MGLAVSPEGHALLLQAREGRPVEQWQFWCGAAGACIPGVRFPHEARHDEHGDREAMVEQARGRLIPEIDEPVIKRQRNGVRGGRQLHKFIDRRHSDAAGGQPRDLPGKGVGMTRNGRA